MQRRLMLSLATLLLPTGALAQPATMPRPGSGPPPEMAERQRWLEENWDELPRDQRRQAEERFGRGMGPQGPGPEEMRRRWQGMTPEQRRELMFGHGRMGPRRPNPPPPPPPPPPGPGPGRPPGG